MSQYGCFNRLPIVTFGATTCQYTKTVLGQADKKCEGCKESDRKQEEAARPKWTDKPEELTKGAYWYGAKGYEPEIVWIYQEKVFGIINSLSCVSIKSHLVGGAMFYGPLDLPPPMPDNKGTA